jgi:hypothetical protein
MTELEDCTVDQLRGLLASAESALFGLEYCPECFRGCMTESPEETAFWIDRTLELRRQFRAELERRGEDTT